MLFIGKEGIGHFNVLRKCAGALTFDAVALEVDREYKELADDDDKPHKYSSLSSLTIDSRTIVGGAGALLFYLIDNQQKKFK